MIAVAQKCDIGDQDESLKISAIGLKQPVAWFPFQWLLLIQSGTVPDFRLTPRSNDMRFDHNEILTIIMILVLAAVVAPAQADDKTLEELKCQAPGVHGKLTIREIQCQPNLQGFNSPTRLPLAAYLHGYRDAYLDLAGALIYTKIEGTTEAQRYDYFEDVKYCMRFLTVEQVVNETEDLDHPLWMWANNAIGACTRERDIDRRNAAE